MSFLFGTNSLLFWSYVIGFQVAFLVVFYLLGLLVERYQMRVNYTRKVIHILMFLAPRFYSQIDVIQEQSVLFIFLTTGALYFWFAPPLLKFSVLRVAFSSFDRPEDRPHTFLLVISQITATFVAADIALNQLASHGLLFSFDMIIFIIAFGDGLAEAVGVTIGRARYRVWSLISGRTEHHRTLEGSFCLWLVGTVVVFLFQVPIEKSLPFLLVLLVLPLAAAIVEALSPHAWDNPILLLSLTGVLIGIQHV